MSVFPARYNFKIWRGTDWSKGLTLLESNATSEPRDLTGYTGSMVVYNPRTQEVLATFDDDNGGVSIGGEDGVISLSIPDTEDLAFQTGVYELSITSPDNVTEVLLWGNFSITGI